jgi:hypothetical protein
MDDRSLSALLALMDQPILLRLHVASLRNRKDLDESVLGFIALYDECEGDGMRIRKQLAANKKSILSPLHAKKTSKYRILKYAAIFIFAALSSVGAIQLLNSNQIELSNTFKDPGLPNYMGTSASVDLSDAMFHYKKQDFEKAEAAIVRVKESHPNNDTVQYYSTLFTFENGEHEVASKQFETIWKSRSKFADRAAYFIGVHATEMDQRSRAIRIFKILSKSEDEFLRAASKAHLLQLLHQ